MLSNRTLPYYGISLFILLPVSIYVAYALLSLGLVTSVAIAAVELFMILFIPRVYPKSEKEKKLLMAKLRAVGRQQLAERLEK